MNLKKVIEEKERLIEYHRVRHEKYEAKYNQSQAELSNLSEKHENLKKNIGKVLICMIVALCLLWFFFIS